MKNVSIYDKLSNSEKLSVSCRGDVFRRICIAHVNNEYTNPYPLKDSRYKLFEIIKRQFLDEIKTIDIGKSKNPMPQPPIVSLEELIYTDVYKYYSPSLCKPSLNEITEG